MRMRVRTVEDCSAENILLLATELKNIGFLAIRISLHRIINQYTVTQLTNSSVDKHCDL